jgi:hypothetical protein
MNVVCTLTEGFGCGFDLEEGDLFVEVDSCGEDESLSVELYRVADFGLEH